MMSSDRHKLPLAACSAADETNFRNVEFDPQDLSPLLPLVEGRDYYVENGFWVFTSHYLKKRGKCCKSGCKNCPFKKK